MIKPETQLGFPFYKGDMFSHINLYRGGDRWGDIRPLWDFGSLLLSLENPYFYKQFSLVWLSQSMMDSHSALKKTLIETKLKKKKKLYMKTYTHKMLHI